jgi:hypothetical protein
VKTGIPHRDGVLGRITIGKLTSSSATGWKSDGAARGIWRCRTIEEGLATALGRGADLVRWGPTWWSRRQLTGPPSRRAIAQWSHSVAVAQARWRRPKFAARAARPMCRLEVPTGVEDRRRRGARSARDTSKLDDRVSAPPPQRLLSFVAAPRPGAAGPGMGFRFGTGLDSGGIEFAQESFSERRPPRRCGCLRVVCLVCEPTGRSAAKRRPVAASFVNGVPSPVAHVPERKDSTGSSSAARSDG